MADIRRFGDALSSDLRAAFLAAVSAATNLVDEAQIERLLLSRDLNGLRSLAQRLATEGFIAAAGPFLNTFEQIFRTAGTSLLVAAEMPRFLPRISSYLSGPPAYFLEGLGRDITISVIQSIERNYAAGANVPKMARDIRHAIGLLPSHEAAVHRYEQTMLENGVAQNLIDRNVTTYRNRLLNWRADMIARTETLHAAHAGQLESWKAKLDAGTLIYSRTWMVWDVTEDDRLCERCAPLDGERVRIGDLFVATHKGFPDGLPEDTPRRPRRKGGLKPGSRKAQLRDEWLDGELVPLKRPLSVPHPPLHPQCRCTMRLVFDRQGGLQTP